jgi:hypothetical protein
LNLTDFSINYLGRLLGASAKTDELSELNTSNEVAEESDPIRMHGRVMWKPAHFTAYFLTTYYRVIIG